MIRCVKGRVPIRHYSGLALCTAALTIAVPLTYNTAHDTHNNIHNTHTAMHTQLCTLHHTHLHGML